MPLNDYPSGQAHLRLLRHGRRRADRGRQRHPGVADHARARAASSRTARSTWHWHTRSPVASYLVEDSVGDYRLTERTADNGTRYYEAQDAGISAEQQDDEPRRS